MKNIAFLLLSIFGLFGCQAQTPDFFDEADAVFSSHVKDGLVDYAAIKRDPAKLDKAIASAKRFKPTMDDPKTYRAFWINAYNLAVIKAISNKYPVKSPMDIKGFFDKTKHDLGGTSITLNDIENKMLRAKFPKEPRFHFVLVCAGMGCPPIIDRAYLPKTLDKQLERQTKLSINNPDFIKIKGNQVQLSEIFKWYKEDFVHDGNELDFINKYLDKKAPAGSKISYYPYDWTLNKVN